MHSKNFRVNRCTAVNVEIKKNFACWFNIHYCRIDTQYGTVSYAACWFNMFFNHTHSCRINKRVVQWKNKNNNEKKQKAKHDEPSIMMCLK
jgi:hypothetical protein